MKTSLPSRFGLVAVAAACLLATCHARGSEAAQSARPIRLRDVTGETGIAFVHSDGSSGRRYIVETVCSGLALFDFDADGDEDIYFLNGAPLPGAENAGPTRNALYRNDGNWRFTDVTAASGLGHAGYAMGVCTGDFDGDGHEDVFVNNFGPNVLFRNNGDGTFTDVTEAAGVAGDGHIGAGACFLDMDGDGDLDLFVASYVGFTFDTHRIAHMNGHPAYVGPLQYPPTQGVLYRNNGDGTFTDVSVSSGIAGHRGSGMGVIAVDLDLDGDPDLIVGNDLRPNFVFRNDGAGRFAEVGVEMGLAFDGLGRVQGTMGVECADWNNDGWPDVFMTSYQRELATLYQSQDGRYFEDVTRRTGAGAGSYAEVTWGAALVDLDNDGHRDLFIACGHLLDNVELFDDTTRYAAPNLVLRNNARGAFINVSDACSDSPLPVLSSRGAAFDDLDGDGRVDIVVLNPRREPTILRNLSSPSNNWIQIRLRGAPPNTTAVGARVRLSAGALTLSAEVHSGRGYQSDYGKRLHFGLGGARSVDELEVRWPRGGTHRFRNLPVNRSIRISEADGSLSDVSTASR